MKKTKKLLAVLICFSLAALVACTTPAPAPQTEPDDSATASPLTVNILALKGPTGVGMVKMMEDGATGSALTYNFSVVGSPDEAVAALTSGQADVAAIPTNLAAKLWAKTNGDLQMIAINALGPLYLVENGETISSVNDLKGKTILATGEGANPQYVLEYLLRQSGLEPGVDVTIEYRSEHSEVATLLASGEGDVALLPEPFVSTVMGKNATLRVALDINQLWDEKASGKLTMGCLVATSSFIKEHPEAIKDLLSDLENSIGFAQDSPAEAAQLCAKHGIIENPDVAEKAIPRCGLVFIPEAEMEPAIRDFFELLNSSDPQALGGSLPASEFYYVG